ncbi:hypothetical protein HAX54_049477, partial [Datura stramonium]|nr:hypothetical protein [Datura stramonium]
VDVWYDVSKCVRNGSIEIHGNSLGMTTIGYSSVSPLIPSCITSAVCGSGPVTRRFVTDGRPSALVYYFPLASQRRTTDTTLRLAGAAKSLKDNFASLLLISIL